MSICDVSNNTFRRGSCELNPHPHETALLM